MATAILARDYPVIQGGLLVTALMFVGINLAVDVLYAWLDPRIRYE
jgi:peptide/nickel transport system permease protein